MNKRTYLPGYFFIKNNRNFYHSFCIFNKKKDFFIVLYHYMELDFLHIEQLDNQKNWKNFNLFKF